MEPNSNQSSWVIINFDYGNGAIPPKEEENVWNAIAEGLWKF